MDLRSVPPRSATGIYRGPVLCRLAHISYRQLDYWARTGLLQPSVAAAAGSGSQRLYSRDDILLAIAIRRLLVLGVSLQFIRAMVDPGFAGGPVGLREAIARQRKRWSTPPIGGAGLWLDLADLRRSLEETEGRFTEPAA